MVTERFTEIPGGANSPPLQESQVPKFAEVVIDKYAQHVTRTLVFADVWDHEIGREHEDEMTIGDWYEELHRHFGTDSTETYNDYLQRQAVRMGVDVLFDRGRKQREKHLKAVTRPYANKKLEALLESAESGQ